MSCCLVPLETDDLPPLTSCRPHLLHPDLQKQRDSLFIYLQELSKARPRGKSDDNLMNDIARCDSELALVRDDLVRLPCSFWLHRPKVSLRFVCV